MIVSESRLSSIDIPLVMAWLSNLIMVEEIFRIGEVSFTLKKIYVIDTLGYLGAASIPSAVV